MTGHSARRYAVVVVSTLATIFSFVGFGSVAVQAASGSYSLNFAAANPQNYAPRSPSQLACPTPSGSSGRAADPLANAAFGNPKAYVESLTPKDLALGQIVAFEVNVNVSGSTAPENGAISFSADWLAKTTSGDDFGFDTSYGLYCAFVDTADTATSDPGHDAKVASYTSATAGAGTNNERIAATVNLAGLDDGDNVVVELWVVLDKTIPAGASGNVQTSITSAQTSSGDSINVGAQTVPLKNVHAFFTENADLSVSKSDSPDPVVAGQRLTYTLTVTNHSTDTVANAVSVTDKLDPNTSFVSASGATCTPTTAGVPPVTTVSCDLGALSPGASATITIVVNVSVAAPDNDKSGNAEAGGPGTACTGTIDLCNAVSVTAATADTNAANNAYVQPTNVTPANAALSIDKTVQEKAYGKVGDVLHYSYEVTNAGNVTLTDPITVVDNKTTVSCPALPAGGLVPAAKITCTATYTVTQADLDAGSITNTAFAKSGAVQSPPDSVTVPATQVRALAIDKSVREAAYYHAGDQLHYSYVVTNVGSVTLKDPVTVTDTKTTVTCPALPAGGLAPGASITCTATYTVTAADVTAGSVTNSAYATSGATQSPPDSATVPLVAAVTGHVTVVKQLDGPIAGAETAFTFAVSCPTTGYATTLTVDAASGSGSASTPDAIPVGTSCQVSEVGTHAHWTLTSASPNTPSAPTVASASAGLGSSTANTVTFVNRRLTDTVTVKKTRVGEVAGAGTDFVFQLTCPAYVTASGPEFPWAQQTLTVDTSATPAAVAESDPIPTGVACDVAEIPTDGWQQTDPAAGAGITITVPGTAPFVNTRNEGALQLVKSVHTLAGPTANVGSFVAGEPENTLVYTLTMSESQPGQLDHTGVVVSDYLPGYGPDPGKMATTYVEGSATCSTGCTVTYDAGEHQLNWAVGDFGHADAPVVMTFRVTIDSPTPLANGGIPAANVNNVGWVDSKQQVDTPSNEVKTPITAVLGEKKHRQLPFTGSPVSLPGMWQLGVLLIGMGVALEAVRRRRDEG